MTANVPCGTPAGRFAVLIPVYNHAGGVASVIERALALHLPVWVVDDGSTDGTAEALAVPPGSRSCGMRKTGARGRRS